jgi:monoamine oxidase
MRRSFHSPLTAMIREAHAASAQAEASGAPIGEVTQQRAELSQAAVSRRDFARTGAAVSGIAVSGIAVSGFAAPRPAGRPGARAASQPRIVIIGAGAAGLRCAHRLWRSSGWKSAVYEANDDVGGRIETNRHYFAHGQIVEMHGEFISSEHTATLALARSFGLALDDTRATPAGTDDTYWFGGARDTQRQLNADWREFGWKTFNRAVRTVPWPQTHHRHSATGRAWDKMTIPEWMDRHLPGGTATSFGRLLLQDVIAEFGGDPGDQSALNLTMLLGYDDSATGAGYQPRRSPVLAGSNERWHITGGNDQLITGMVRQLPPGTIRVGHVLRAVRKHANGTFTCTFSCDRGVVVDVVADRLVFACPFKTLREVDLSRAGLSALKLRAIRNLGMGSNGKVIMQFNGHPWVRDGYTGNAIADTGAQSAWEANYQAGNYSSPAGLLVDYPGGSHTHRILSRYRITRHEGVAPAKLVTDTLAHLEPLFPGASAAYNGRAWYHFGSNDPYVQGAYSYWRVGQYTQFAGYEGVAEGSAHFCGEHTSHDFQGFIEGAVRSGERAAREVRGR